MSSDDEEVELHIKVVINKEKTKVLFAEAGSDFTNVLLSFLLLPLGKIVRVLKSHYGDEAPIVGSLNTLYDGVANLDIIHYDHVSCKENLLLPKSCYDAATHKLKIKVDCTQPAGDRHERPPYDGAFTHEAASFIITDDLRLMPNVAGSIMKTFNILGFAAADMDGVEIRDMVFGVNEVMTLLKESLISTNPMTALVFPGKKRMNVATKGDFLLTRFKESVASMNNRKIIVKVMVQKSTDKLLFVEADNDFINFIFSLLTIPLGKVEWFLCSNTGLKNIDNLHRSIADKSEIMNLKHPMVKDVLIKSIRPYDYYLQNIDSWNEFSDLNFDYSETNIHVNVIRMYMVSDDLTVVPLGITSCFSVLNGLKISLSDVEELKLQVGLEEGLSILQAALTSTTALTDGLLKPVLMKKRRQEMLKQIKTSMKDKRRRKLESGE